jgi:hypothetical protein
VVGRDRAQAQAPVAAAGDVGGWVMVIDGRVSARPSWSIAVEANAAGLIEGGGGGGGGRARGSFITQAEARGRGQSRPVHS